MEVLSAGTAPVERFVFLCVSFHNEAPRSWKIRSTSRRSFGVLARGAWCSQTSEEHRVPGSICVGSFTMGDEGEKQVEIWKVKRVSWCCCLFLLFVQLLTTFVVEVY